MTTGLSMWLYSIGDKPLTADSCCNAIKGVWTTPKQNP